MMKIRYYGLLTLLCLCLYLPGVAVLPLFDRDEPHFAQASRQMVATQNYWRIYFQYQPRHLKPPGIYWLQATAVRLFSSADSTSAWPYRLPSVLGAWLAVLLTFAVGQRLSNTRTAGLAAISLACSLLVMIQAHLALTDAVLLASIVAMQWGLGEIYWRSHQSKTVNWQWPCLFWVAMAAGIFIKGVSPLFGGLTILGLLITDRKGQWLKGLRCSWGIPLLLILTAAWLIPFSMASGHNFLWDMISGDVLPKLSGGQQSHGMPPGYFTLIFTAAFWPASLFIIPAGIWSWRHRGEPTVRFLLAWIIPAWIFFELVPTKLPEYVLPTYPAIALLIALTLADGIQLSASRWLRILRILQQGLWIICTLALAGAMIYLGGWGWLAAALVLAAGGYLLYIVIPHEFLVRIISVAIIPPFVKGRLGGIYKYKNPPQSPFFKGGSRISSLAATGIILAAAAFIPIWQFLLPGLQPLWISRQLSALISQAGPQVVDDLHPVLAVDYREPSLVFELGIHRVLMMNISRAIARFQQQSHGVILVSGKSLVCFSQLTHERKLSWQSLGTVHGFQYNHTGLTRIFHHQATANAKEPESLGVFAKTAWLHSTAMRPRGFDKNTQIFRPFHVLATPDGEISGLTNIFLFLTSGGADATTGNPYKTHFLGSLVRGGDPVLLFCGSASDDFTVPPG
jgi:4-amino-4-deoxy-L-arabinose transferase-like glycosyltransferase